MKVMIERVCAYCKNKIQITKDSLDKIIYYNKSTYHNECFENFCRAKCESKRCSAKWKEIFSNMAELKQASYGWFNEMLSKEEIYRLIQSHYDITVVPSNVFTRLSDIYKGKYKAMGEGIPPSHLLDMWTRKLDYLDKIADQKKTQGCEMSTNQRIIYDIAVLVNKYDSYKKWLEGQKVLQSENRTKEEKQKQNFEIRTVTQSLIHSVNSVEKDDISDLVDDIFEDDILE